MIKINYWTSQYFEENVWDKYYCKTFTSAKIRLKEVMDKDTTLKWLKGVKEDIIKQYDKWVFNKKTCFGVWNANISNSTLYISVEEIILD